MLLPALFLLVSVYSLISSVGDTGLGSGLAFCCDDTSVWISQDLVFWLAASQCLFAFRLELPNRLALTPFQDARQSVHKCQSPDEPKYLIFLGCDAFRHLWIVQSSLWKHVQMSLLPISGARPKDQLTSASMD